MTLRIRQLALVAKDLEPAVQALSAALSAEVCYRDPGVGNFGLHNALLCMGDTFLEVVSPMEAGTTAGRLLERRGGDGGYMVLLQTDDLASDRERFASLGVRTVWEIALEDIACVHLHPKDVGAAIVSFDEPTPAESWRWGGPDWQRYSSTERVLGIVGADLQSGDPQALSARWAQVLGRPCEQVAADVHAIPLDGGELRFVLDRDGRGDGLAAVRMQCAPGTALQDTVLCGTRFCFVD